MEGVQSMSVVLISLACVLGLVLCFASYKVKRKPYLYARNAIIVAFGALFFLTILINNESLRGYGINVYVKLKETFAWWQIILKIIVPLIAALTTVFLAQLPQKAYETVSTALIALPLGIGLYLTPEVSQGVFTALVFVYTVALIAVGLFMFRTYFCVETAAVGGFLVAWLLKRFYVLSNVTMYVIAGVLTLLGAGLCIFLAARKDKKDGKDKKDKTNQEKEQI